MDEDHHSFSASSRRAYEDFSVVALGEQLVLLAGDVQQVSTSASTVGRLGRVVRDAGRCYLRLCDQRLLCCRGGEVLMIDPRVNRPD